MAAFITQLVSRILRRSFSLGSVDIGMSKPFSLREFVANAQHVTSGQGVFGFCGVRASALDVPRLSRSSSPTHSLDFERVTPAPIDASEPETTRVEFVGTPAVAAARSTQASASGSGSDSSSVRSRSRSPIGSGMTSPPLVVDVGEGLGEKNRFARDLAARLATLVPPRPRSAGRRLDWTAGPESVPTSTETVAQALTHHVMNLCNSASVVIPTAIVGTIMLTHYKRGLSRRDLIECATWLRSEIRDRGFRVASRSRSSIQDDLAKTVDRVLSSVDSGSSNEMVKRFRGDTLLFGLYSPEERMLLVFYRNQLMHVFLTESLVCAAMYAVERKRESFPTSVSGSELRRYTHFLGQLFRFEFALPPSSFHRDTFSETLDSLVSRGIFARTETQDETNASYFSVDSSGDAELVDTTFVSHGTGMYLWLCALMWPFVDSYWLAGLGLFALVGAPGPIPLDTLVVHIQTNLGEAVFFSGQLDLYEACSRDTLLNALRLYSRWGLVFIEDGNVCLTPTFSTYQSVQTLVRRVASFKKRSRAYSSRRYRAVSCSDLEDAEAHAMRTAPLLWGDTVARSPSASRSASPSPDVTESLPGFLGAGYLGDPSEPSPEPSPSPFSVIGNAFAHSAPTIRSTLDVDTRTETTHQ